MKTTLFIMGKKGLDSLAYLVANFGIGCIDRVYTHQDYNVQNDFYTEISTLCHQCNIPNITLTGNEVEEEMRIDTEFAIVIAWRWMIRSYKKLIVIHDSLLPAYSGFSPLVNALANQEPVIGVSAITGTEEYDKGQIIAQERLGIDYPITIKEAIRLVSELYQKICGRIMNNEVMPIHAPESARSFSMWLDDLDYRIDWSWSASKIVSFVNAVGWPYKGAHTMMRYHDKHTLVRVLECEVGENVQVIDRERHIGKVIFIKPDAFWVVAGTGGGLVKVTLAKVRAEKLKLPGFRVRFT